MISNLKQLDWSGWVYGLLAATIGGGASAVSSAVGAMILAPKDFNLVNPNMMLKLMLITFGINAVLSLFLYLKQSPLPRIESETITTTETKTETKKEN